MNKIFDPQKDEYDVDFDDPRPLAMVRWEAMVKNVLNSLTPADRKEVSESRDEDMVLAFIEAGLNDNDQLTRTFLLQLKPLPRALRGLVSSFTDALIPNNVDASPLWGLVFLNIKLSLLNPSSGQLSHTVEWSIKLRRAAERFNRVYRLGNESKNEATLALIDTLEIILGIMGESVRYLRGAPSRRIEDDAGIWKGVLSKIKASQKDLDDTIKHLNEINTYSQANQQRVINNLQLKHTHQDGDGENVGFPICKVPFERNKNFHARDDEIKQMDRFLRPDKTRALRCYSIYGRRGVGKTEIALEYAYRNPSGLDAIFWIRCETSLTLRTSFTSMAIGLGMPGADSKRSHEENLLNVQRWLKETRKSWLLIFDNADKDSELILRSYWPIGANGAILITSRDYYNFMKDDARKGQTVRPFNETQSWDLLFKLMGPEWSERYRLGKMNEADITAAKAWIRDLGGLPLSIQTASSLILNPKPQTGESIVETYKLFLKCREDLPPRQLAERSPLIETLDALFDMIFRALSPNSLKILNVLALLSPDAIPIELFLPLKQAALNGKLEFAKQESPVFVNEKDGQTTLFSVIKLAPKLSASLEELSKNNLIRWDHRTIAVHRVIQDSMNWSSRDDLQESFASVVRLVYEAFPKQVQAGTMYDAWKVCENYITHAVHLARKFAEYQNPKKLGDLNPTIEFVELQHNATWFLYEMSDYDLSNEVIDIAKAACENKESHVFALLCNTHGCNYSELNQMKKTRLNFERALEIREKMSDDTYKADHAVLYHNMGNLESSTQHYDEALGFYQQAVEIYSALGDSVVWLLGITYLGMGRCYVALKNYNEARKLYGQAEQLFVRTKGADKHFMAHCHYAYGNLEFEEALYESATSSYEACLTIASAELPIHPITAAAYYSLGCTEIEMKNFDRAKRYLKKARNIAELRSPKRDDGTVARILWKTAMVLRANPDGTTYEEAREADELLAKAYIARTTLVASGESAEANELDLLDDREMDSTMLMKIDEESFDLLVPGFFR